jgi:hypothetical protein
MTEQYLIAIKVRGEPAFEVAIKMECAICQGTATIIDRDMAISCSECEGDGYWWMTHYGHRAHPYWHRDIEANGIPPMPDDLPEHFQASAAPKGKGSGIKGRDLLLKIGLLQNIPRTARRSW